jgi:hypothetical protein
MNRRESLRVDGNEADMITCRTQEGKCSEGKILEARGIILAELEFQVRLRGPSISVVGKVNFLNAIWTRLEKATMLSQKRKSSPEA